LEIELRLADRRGVFQRRHISPVAEYGLSLLMFREGQERKERELDSIRLSLLSSGRARPDYVFPEAFGQFDSASGYQIVDDGTEESDQAISKAKRTGEVDYDYSDVEWASPSGESEELAELMQLQAALLGAQAITITDED
jgi:hypothetical protein